MFVEHTALTSPCEQALGAGLRCLLQGRGQHKSRESAIKETLTPLTIAKTNSCHRYGCIESQSLKGKQKTPPHSVEEHKKFWQSYQPPEEGLSVPRPFTIVDSIVSFCFKQCSGCRIVK